MVGDWMQLKIGECLDRVIDNRGKTPPTKVTRTSYELIEVNAIRGGSKFPNYSAVRKFVDKDTYIKWFRSGHPVTGDVLISTVGSIAEVAISEGRGCIAQNVVALRPKAGKVDGNFLYYLLSNPYTKARLVGLDISSVQPSIKVPHLLNINVCIPPYKEQNKIADILGALDDKIALNQRMNRALEGIARAIFMAWFIDFEPVKAKAAGATSFPGMPQVVFDKLPDQFTETELGMVPVGWDVVALSNLVELIGGGTPKRKVAEYWDGSIPWFSVRDAPAEHDVWVIGTEERITESGVESSSARVMREGTTIISARGTVGRLALTAVPMAINQSCYGIQGSNGVGDFFVYFTIHDAIVELQQRAHGSVFDTITRQTFDTLQRVRPQVELLDAFEDAVMSFLNLMRNNLFESRVLAGMRDSLLPKLISGEIKVPDIEGVNHAG